MKIIDFNEKLKAKTNHKMVRPAGVELLGYLIEF